MSVLTTAVDAAIDLVSPRRCVGCGVAGAVWCRACRPADRVLRRESEGWITVGAARYDGAVRAAMLRYKERGRRDLGPPLADLLAVALAGALDELGTTARAVRVVPVPSSRRAAAARGGDHVLRLARRAARGVHLPVVATLGLTRRVADSADLSAAQRRVNLADAFVARPPGAARVALLVDDIVTTGATLADARRALCSAGWVVPAAAVVAVTRPGADWSAHGQVLDHPLAVPRRAV